MSLKCARCGTELHEGSNAIISAQGHDNIMNVFEYSWKKALRCPKCRKIFCGECSIRVDEELGRPDGAVDYTCPFCRTTGIG